SPPPIGTNALPLTMGALTDGTRGFEGSMDDVRIYNVALGADEVQNLATLNANIRMASSEIEETIQKEEEVMEVEMNEFDVKMEELNNEFSAHPNPFSTSTAVSFSLSKGGAYLVVLYDSRGAKVADLQQGLAVPGEKIALEVDGAGM